VASDLARKANAQDLGRGAGSDTFQKLALSNIAERSGAPAWWGRRWTCRACRRWRSSSTASRKRRSRALIAKSLLEPKTAAQLMEDAIKAGKPQPIGNILLSNPSRAAQLLGARAGDGDHGPFRALRLSGGPTTGGWRVDVALHPAVEHVHGQPEQQMHTQAMAMPRKR
jgi:hypothetical protein